MIGTAFLFAMKAHEGQYRKDGRAYLVHPVEVAMELAKNGAEDEVICAGLLHDTIEDTSVTAENLQQVFPEEVTSLVIRDSEDKSLNWEERKSNTIAILKDPNTSKEYKMLMCADKLANLKNVQDEMKEIGENVFLQFKRGKEKQAWLYRELVEAMSDLSDLKMYQELKQITEEVFRNVPE